MSNTQTSFTVLSNSAVIFDAQDYRQQAGLTVLQHPASGETCELISVGAATYRADAFIRDGDRLTHEAGWSIRL